MNISRIFIVRPVMTTLLMAAFLLAGLFGYAQLPTDELPQMDFPTVQVQASLRGANAKTMATSVATPLEKIFSTIPGLDTMSSSSNQGFTEITLTFNLDRDIDAATADVQAAVSAASFQLPRDMPSPPSVRKMNPADQPIFFLAISSRTQSIVTVNEYAEDRIVPHLATIDGVSQVNINGQKKAAVRVQLDPNAMAVRGIGIDQVAAAIRAANVNQPTGQLDSATHSTIIYTEGQLSNAESFARQIVTYRDGAPVRISDIGTVIDSVENLRGGASIDGYPGVILAIQRQPGANTVAVVDRIRAQLPHIQSQLPPSIEMKIMSDRSESIRHAVFDVQLTLIFSALLVVAVIFVFLRTVSATFIPSIAMPIAIVGTFAGMAALGFSLDNFSLMALTLSVVFIVDDAIVMLENVMRHVEKGKSPREAALIGSQEVSFTILSMTISLAAVFIPVLFMGGILGRLLNEFAVTIVIAILISGFVSVTLTPMLCSRMVKTAEEERRHRHGKFYYWSENAFNRVQSAYERSLVWSLEHRRLIFGLFFASIALTVVLFRLIPQDFMPAEDTGSLMASTESANGVSFAEHKRHQDEIARIALADPNVESVLSFAWGSSRGNVRMVLKPASERPIKDIEQIMAQLRRKFAPVPGISVFVMNPPALRLGGMQGRSQYQYTLQDLDTETLYAATTKFLDALSKEPGFVDVNSNYDRTAPSVNVAIDRDRAAALGVSVQQIETALGSAFGGQQVSTVYTSTNQYAVMLELLPKFQEDASSLSRLYLTGTGGRLVPLSAVTDITQSTILLTENHLGQLPAVTISFGLQPGVPLSTGIERLERVKREIGMPASIQGSFQGTAAAFQDSSAGMGFLLIGGILVVYIVLGILYESFIHPLTILSGLPAAAVGALFTLWLFGIPLTLYAFVGMIMLVGLVKKNAIMMIDFALTRQREQGVDPESAIVEAALVRFRPIMMTTMAALVGVIPIALGMGAGGASRQPLGVAVVGGLAVSQALTLYITPVIYSYLDRLSTRWSRRGAKPVPSPAE